MAGTSYENVENETCVDLLRKITVEVAKIEEASSEGWPHRDFFDVHETSQ